VEPSNVPANGIVGSSGSYEALLMRDDRQAKAVEVEQGGWLRQSKLKAEGVVQSFLSKRDVQSSTHHKALS
jgi:hypothetical protein